MTRQCNECQLCCRLLPVRAINKLGNTKCQHQKFGVGCVVYNRLEQVAPECRLWTCRWLNGDDCDDLRRPDRSHYVIDVMPSPIYLTLPGDTESIQLLAAQIWVDPKFPDAHRDPALRDWINRKAEQGELAAAIIRYGPKTGFTIFPPAVTGGEWIQNDTAPSPDCPDLVDAILAGMSAGISK